MTTSNTCRNECSGPNLPPILRVPFDVARAAMPAARILFRESVDRVSGDHRHGGPVQRVVGAGPGVHLEHRQRWKLESKQQLDARAAPPEAHESLISRKTGAEVPLTGLSFMVGMLLIVWAGYVGAVGTFKRLPAAKRLTEPYSTRTQPTVQPVAVIGERISGRITEPWSDLSTRSRSSRRRRQRLLCPCLARQKSATAVAAAAGG
jgi:hypothetical protein